MPEGTGFSSRGGLTRAQPGPGGDVACPVKVGVDLAVGGADHDVLLGAGASVSAVVAFDASADGVHEHHLPTSFFRFADENVGELRPARIQDRLVEPGFGTCPVGQEYPWVGWVWLGCGPT